MSEAAIAIPNIYYDFDRAELTDEARTSISETLLKILNDNPGFSVEIGPHTDSRGEDSYNLTLSQERAQSVVDYLISRGIEASRLDAKGYGESKPIAANELEDGSDNPAGRSMNRRTEFRIVGNISRF